MQVRRIVKNVRADDISAAKAFYTDVFGLDTLMDMDWVMFLGTRETGPVQLGILSAGGSGAPVPDMTIEVDNVDIALERCHQVNAPIEYGPADESWGVRRFFVRDPYGTLINVMAHSA